MDDLDRAYVEIFKRSPDPWLTTDEAAEHLGWARSYVLSLARRRGVHLELDGRRFRLDRDAVLELAVDRRRWISEQAAAELTGCSHEAVGRAARCGEIERRPNHRRYGPPSLDRASVLAWADASTRAAADATAVPPPHPKLRPARPATATCG